jgi:hypothetical protein
MFGKRDDRTEKQKDAAESAAISEAESFLSEPNATPDGVRAKLPSIKSKHGLSSIDLVHEDATRFHVSAVINRMSTRSHDLKRSGGAFSLAPGGLKEHEGTVILTSGGQERTIHVIEKHGRDVTVAFLKERLTETIEVFRKERARKLQNWSQGLARAGAEYGRLSGRPQPLTPAEQRRFDEASEVLASIPQKMQWLNGIRDSDRDEIQRFFEDELHRTDVPFRATKFYNNKVMVESIEKVLADSKDRINNDFNDDQGRPKANGTRSSKLSGEFIGNIGIGYELDDQMEVARIPMMRHVGVIAVISDSEKRHYKVQTAYPEP